MRASKAMQHRVNSLDNIEIRYNTEVDTVLGDQVVEGLRMVNNITGEKRTLQLQDCSLLLAINQIPIFLRGNWKWMKRVI